MGVFADTIRGTDGNDDLIGTSDNDDISGLGGNDRMSGLGGNDKLILMMVTTKSTGMEEMI